MAKRLTVFLLAMVMAVAIGFGSFSTPAQAALVTLNLKAVWNPNPEPDMSFYLVYAALPNTATWYFFNTDAFDTPIIGTIDGTKQGTHLPLSPCSISFNQGGLDDTNPVGWIDYALKAADMMGNVSTKAIYRFEYNIDATPPSIPTGFKVTKQ